MRARARVCVREREKARESEVRGVGDLADKGGVECAESRLQLLAHRLPRAREGVGERERVCVMVCV